MVIFTTLVRSCAQEIACATHVHRQMTARDLLAGRMLPAVPGQWRLFRRASDEGEHSATETLQKASTLHRCALTARPAAVLRAPCCQRQVMSGVSEDVEVHTDIVETLRSIFVHGSETTSISEGFLGSVKTLAGANPYLRASSTRAPPWPYCLTH